MNGADELAAEFRTFRRDALEESRMTDSLAGHLEYRVIALEEILAARWPRRWLLAARLRRELRRSVQHHPGETWAERRVNAAGADWLARVTPGGALRPPGGAR